MSKARILVFIALFVSMDVVLRRFLSVQTPTLRIDFAFIPLAFSGMLFGPLAGAVTGALADIVGMLIAPKSAYFPGFTFSLLATGAIYGFFLYGKPKSMLRVFLASLVVMIFVDLGLNTLWLSMIYNKAALAIITPRLIKSLIMLPVQTVMIQVLWRYTGNYLKSSAKGSV